MKGLNRIKGAPYRLEGTNKHAILLIHGLMASAATVRPLADVLHRAGYSVLAPNLQGHGKIAESPRDFGRKDWLEDALNGFDALYADYQHISVIGHSLGGVLALLTAQQRPVWKCIPIAADIRPNLVAQCWKAFLSPFQTIGQRSKKDPGTDVGYDSYPPTKVYDLYRLACLARRNLRRIYCPLLCVTAGLDKAVHPAGGKLIIDGISSQEKELLLLKESSHNLLSEPEVDVMYEEILEFLLD